MGFKEINEQNRKYMRSELNNSLNFEWEDTSLLNEIIKKIEKIYPSSSDPKEYQTSNDHLDKINDLFEKLYKRKISNKKFLKDLEKEFNAVYEKYPNLVYNYKYKIEIYEKIIRNSYRLLINGCAAIGKSYFINQLEAKLTEMKILHMCVYGKYNKTITEDIFKEISRISDEFYLIIDAINEFDEEEQINIINHLEKLEKKENINIIVSYRNASLKAPILLRLKKIIKNNYEFKGVDFQSSLLMMIETYGIDSIKYLDVIESNNPLYLKMLNNILSSKKLKLETINGVVQVTFIMEQYIKKMCGRDYWNYVKDIGDHMLDMEKPYICEHELKSITGNSYDDFVNKLIENDFIFFREEEGIKTYWFKIQQLADYIIARPLFEKLSNKTEDEIVETINRKINKIYTLHEAISILLFEKYKDFDINIALRIFIKTNLHKNVDLNIFRKISLNKKQINIVQNFFNIEMNSDLYSKLAGFPNRPFNCINYINSNLLKKNDYNLDIVERFRESEYILHLKNIVYSLPFLEGQNDFIDEYFYYAFWLMSSPNGRIRNLSIKIVYDLVYKKKELRKILINYYKKINDFYIKKGIVYILTKLPKDNNTIRFIKKIYKNKKELDAEIVYRTTKYLNKEENIPIIHKFNYYKKFPKKISIDENLNLTNIMFIADLYEKYLFKFERYPKEEHTLSLYENFIINNSRSIKKYNKRLKQKFSCIKDNGYCKYSLGGNYIKEKMYKLDITPIDTKRMFLIYQELFKDVCKLYNYDYSKEERFDYHINRFEDSILKKILLIAQDLLLGSLMTNYFTEEFSVYNDEQTLGYKPYSYITYDEEEIYLTTPISPYNELVDKLNYIKCEQIEFYKERDKKWHKNVQQSIDTCSKLTKEVIYNKESWSLIGGSVQRFIPKEINEFYSCYMSINPKECLKGDEDSRYLTVENQVYYDNFEEYQNVDYDKNMRIQSFQSNSVDIKESHLLFPPPKLIKKLNLKYDCKTSAWIDEKNNIVILCDNNQKNYFKYPIIGAIYVKTSILNELKKNNNIVYWCYTEKSYGNFGFNEEASLHIELDQDGNPIKIFNNRKLISKNKECNLACKNCKYGIYSESQEQINHYKKFIVDLLDENQK